MQLTGAQALIKSLEQEAVEVIFGLPGGCILPAYDPLLESTIRHILVRHEQGAGHMAEGYAHVTGRPGVAMVTSGPAATNLVTPLMDAYMDSIPMVAITGQVSTFADRQRRVPGVRHGRHHTLGHEAQRARHDGPGPAAGHPPGVPPGLDGAPRAGPRRRAQGRAAELDGVVLAVRRRRHVVAARLPAEHQGPPAHDQGGRPPHPRGRAPRPLHRRRRAQGPRRRRGARARRAARHPRRHHPDGPRRVPRRPSAVPRDARHARQRHGDRGPAAQRPADHARRPLRRPHHRQGRRLRPRGQGHPRRHRPGRAGQGAPARRADRRRLQVRDRRDRQGRARPAGGRGDAGRHVGVEEPHLRVGRSSSR